MEKNYRYKPQNVCSREIVITIDENIIKKVMTVRGCPGNTQGVNRLVEGRDIDEVISKLDGIRCPGSKDGATSCPNELAKALKAIKDGDIKPE